MSIAYRVSAEITGSELMDLFSRASWTRERTADGIERMLKHSPIHITAWNGDSIVGFVLAFTDTIYRATIDDVIVHKAHREAGIATELLRRMSEELKHVDEVYLFCDQDLVSFYDKRGFRPADCATLTRKP